MAKKKTKTLAEIMADDINEQAGNKTAFHRKARAVLKRLAGVLGLAEGDFDIRANKGGAAVSGEVVLHGDRIYVQVAQSAAPGGVLFRRCEGRKDFTGGQNHWAQATELDDVASFAIRLKQELKLDAEGATDEPPAETERMDIPLGKLRRSPKNVRTAAAGEDADRQLAANIQRRGLLQNLIVYDAGDGMHEVAGGGRRLAALQSLDLPEDHPVPCLVAPEALAVELSTAENSKRSTMHPADEAEAFRLMVDEQGRGLGDVAAEFGFSRQLVQQRLRLASLAKDLLEKFRSGEITMEWAKALTVADRHEDQQNAWKQVAHLPDWQDRSAAIKHILSAEKARGDDRLAVFVGIDTYEAAGGEVARDLFSDVDDPESIWLADRQLLQRLALERLEEAAAKLRDHWRWAEARVGFEERELWTSFRQELGTFPDLPESLAAECEGAEQQLDQLCGLPSPSEEQCKEIDRLGTRIAEIEDWPAANVVFSDETRQRAGCIVTIGYQGEVVVHEGLVRPEDDQSDDDQDAAQGDTGTSSPSTPTNGSPSTPAGADDGSGSDADDQPCRISGALGQDLGAYRTLCLQAGLARDPELARDLLLYMLVRDVLRCGGYWDKPSEIAARPAHLTSSQGDLENTPAAKEMAAIRQGLPMSFAMFPPREQMEKIRALPSEDKGSLLAACVAFSLTARSVAPDQSRNDVLDFVQAELGGDQVVASRWRPTAANFFRRIKGAHGLAIGKETLGEDWANRHRSDKKGPLCQALEKGFGASDDEIDVVAPEARARAKAWLPPGMGLGEGAAPAEEPPAGPLPAFLAGGDAEEDESQSDSGGGADELPDFLAGEDQSTESAAA